MLRFLFVVTLVLLGRASFATEVIWQPVQMEQGCVQFSDLYKAYPLLGEARTPEEIVQALQSRFGRVRRQPFLEYLGVSDEQRRKAQQEPETGEKVLYKFLTPTNAFFISWNANGTDDGILLFTTELCMKVYGKK